MFPAAMLRRSRWLSHLFGMVLHTTRRAQRRRLGACSLNWSVVQRITTNDCAIDPWHKLASHEGHGDQGIRPAHARPYFICHDHHDAAGPALIVWLRDQYAASRFADRRTASREQ